MKIVRRDDAELMDSWGEMLKTEQHHDHPITVCENGYYSWKETTTHKLLSDHYDLNDVVCDFISEGLTKNSEEWREFYRDMGYSLYGYWEIFYWEINNEDTDNYQPPKEI